jgi:acyl-CoA synthetase (AMP-forming)/AMP-acid ligase II
VARLVPTFTPPFSEVYGRPGGPWDVPDLDVALSSQPVEVVDGTVRLGGPALDAAVSAVAARLAERDVVRGSVVSWQLPNGLASYLLYRACWRLGAIAAPVHHAAGPADAAAALAQVDPVVVLAGPGMALAASEGTLTVEGPEWDWAAGPPLSPAVATAVAASDLAVVLFTSGSSGPPKAVLHTHRGLVYKARTMAAVHGLGAGDAVLMPAPLAHISGLLNGVLVPGVAGMKTVLMARWQPDAAIELIEQEHVTFMIGPPTFFISLMEAETFSAAGVASLRLISSGGAGVTPAFVARASSSLGCRVKRTYGSTEAPTITTSGPDDPTDRAAETDGRATGEAEVRICDPSSGQAVAGGDIGEVWLRGPEVFVGYVAADANHDAFSDDGWFRTGDLGRLEAGWLTITGRMKDVIIRGGENISAAELEAVLEANPDVSQAVVVGVPDDRYGQRVCAFVVAVTPFDLNRVRSWMEERGVTRFKWPEGVVQVESLPLLAAGKVDRAAVERSAARLAPLEQG